MTTEAVKIVVEAAHEVTLPLPDLSVLRQGRRKPPTFPVEVFGPAWHSWLESAAEGAGAPVDYVAGPLLAATAALIGNARRAIPWAGWKEPPALWIAKVGDPSSNKSPGDDPVLDLLRVIENDMAADFLEIKRVSETAKKAAQCARDRWEKDVERAIKQRQLPPTMPPEAEEPPEVVRPRLIGNDTSTEKLGLLLASHPKGLLFHRD
jgi:hypothetical protein